MMYACEICRTVMGGKKASLCDACREAIARVLKIYSKDLETGESATLANAAPLATGTIAAPSRA